MQSQPVVRLVEISPDNWREVAAVAPRPDQAAFVATPTYYLCLSHFGGEWHCLAIEAEGQVVGHVMWALDDDAAWIGGLVIDARHQGMGFGGATVEALVRRLGDEAGVPQIALSYEPENATARRLYARLGFVETGEMEGEEIVARKTLARPTGSL